MRIQSLFEDKRQVFDLMKRISTEISDNLIKADAFTESSVGPRFRFGRLRQWANLGPLSNMLRSVRLIIEIESKQPTAHVDVQNRELTIVGDNSITSEELAPLIHHELVHLYQQSKSKGKRFVSDKNPFSAPHKAEDSRSEYLKKDFEIEARFKQMVHELSNQELPDGSNELFKFILDAMDRYHLTDVFEVEPGSRTRVRTSSGIVRAPMSNKRFRQLLSRAIHILGDR